MEKHREKDIPKNKDGKNIIGNCENSFKQKVDKVAFSDYELEHPPFINFYKGFNKIELNFSELISLKNYLIEDYSRVVIEEVLQNELNGVIIIKGEFFCNSINYGEISIASEMRLVPRSKGESKIIKIFNSFFSREY